MRLPRPAAGWASAGHCDTATFLEHPIQHSQIAQSMVIGIDVKSKLLELFYLQGHSCAAVARRSGYTANEVKSHIQNGKRSLRILLKAIR